ncbi:MAG: universal stress protein [Saprospiraceae bacterium]|nr:universal stress protein [Saprospiraceae bacterium]
MKPKILIPVDFTKTSFSAFIYGNQLAKHIGADITLIHILQGSFSTADTYFIDTLENTEKLAKKRLEYFTKEYPKEMGYTMHPVSTKYELRYGIPGFTVTDFAADNSFDYIVAERGTIIISLKECWGTLPKSWQKRQNTYYFCS